MSLIKDKAAPGALASELATAKAKHDAAIEQAVAKLETTRGSVIQRGTQRAQEITALQSELQRELVDLQAVVNDAR